MTNPEQNTAKKRKSLFKASSGVSLMTLFSRVLGLFRDIVIAHGFGASAGMDAFLVAFKIPNFLRRLFAEGAFSQAFVPVLSEYRSQKDIASVKHLIDRVAGTMLTTLSAVTLLAMLASPLLIMLFAPGFIQDREKVTLAAEMLRITFPYLFFISLTAFSSGILNSYGKFLVPAITPIFLNIVLIMAAIFLAPHFVTPIKALAWGVFVAGIVQWLWQLPFLVRLRLLPKPSIRWNDPGVKRILRLMIPAIFGVSISQINLLLDTVLASFLQTGSVSWLYFSDRLSELPLGVFGVAIATVILPSLSTNHAEQSKDAFNSTLDWGLRFVLIVGLPSAVGLFLLAEPLIITLFHYGEITVLDVKMTTKSLQAYSLGILAFMLIKVLATGYFSRHDMKTPVRIGVIAMIANMLLNLILIFPLKHVGLALATSLSALINAGLLFWGLYKQKAFWGLPGWKLFFVRLMLANSAMALFLTMFATDAENLLVVGWGYRLQHVIFVVLSAMAIYGATLLILGFRPRHLHRS